MKHNRKKATEKFNRDLNYGENGESEIVKFIKGLGLNFIATSKCLHSDDTYKYYDLLFETKERKEVKFEVKTDKYISEVYDTGNIVVEISCNGKPSGINTTISNVWVNYFPTLKRDNVWMIKTKDLKELIKTERLHISSGGDNNGARLVQIPRNIFKDRFKVYTYNFSTGTSKETSSTNTGYVNYITTTTTFRPFNSYPNPLNDKGWL